MADDGDYKVGYRKPPRQHQYKKGQTGNAGGRPKRQPSGREILDKIFNEMVEVGPDRSKMSRLEVQLRKVVTESYNQSDHRTFLKVLAFKEGAQPPPVIDETEADASAHEELAQRAAMRRARLAAAADNVVAVDEAKGANSQEGDADG